MSDLKRLRVSVSEQLLLGFDGAGERQLNLPVATARNGTGQLNGSECTPLGRHRIRAKIGADAPLNAVFVGRRQTGEVYSEQLASQHPGRDWILTRILWLCGNESGFNRGGDVDTMRRYIYLHGAPDSHPMQIPSSHGCIKLRNADIIALFDRVNVGTEVEICE
ncbi:MAG: L,D-transpeptidase [Gammaproteobacteria bacterium]|nr:L,D-transpeptidase [Gammaproteobacteria bacterium]